MREDRLVIGGAGHVTLVSFPGRTGYALVCDGPASPTAAPLSVVPGANARAMVPLATYSAAALLIPVGAVGLVMLHAGGTETAQPAGSATGRLGMARPSGAVIVTVVTSGGSGG